MSYFDTDGDGILDAADLNGDGLIDAVDLDHDGSIDVVDLDYDGTIDAVDLDGNGVWEPSPLDSTASGYDAGMGGGYGPTAGGDLTGGYDANSGGGYAPASGGTGIDVNGDGTVDGYDTDGDGWVDAVGPGAVAAAEAGAYDGQGGPFPAGQAPPEEPGPYTQREIDQGYSSNDTSFIEPSRFADDASVISNGDITDNL